MRKADASPTKDFFVRMITRDISIEDCLLDLIDNSLDGARRTIAAQNGGKPVVDAYDGYWASVNLTPEIFKITDNCGGISISDAIDYAFHFGRRPDAPSDGDFSIGLYGIGMKRALLKLGKDIAIHSSTNKEAFQCVINVDEWLKHQDWTFDISDADKIEGTGTHISIKDLYQGIAEEFADQAFVNHLTRVTARDYAQFLAKGFRIEINGTTVKGHKYAVRQSDEFKPYRKSYEDETGAHVEIFAGMAAPPPDSLEPSERTDTDYYGWFVLCNDRVVLAANKNDDTVWGTEGFPKWHPQYNGFMGLVIINSSDPNLLPWTTTKRDIDQSSPLYRRAVKEMKVATTPWLEYTNHRKVDLDEARKKEEKAATVALFDIAANPKFTVPIASNKPRVEVVNVHYQKPVSEVKKAAKALGSATMSASRVGEKTFEYFLENEIEE